MIQGREMSGEGGVAAFDIGSNTARGILARRHDAATLHVFDADQRLTALGRGLSESGRFNAEPLDATVAFVAETLERWACPVEVYAVATAAARDAENGDELVERFLGETGVFLRVIDGQEEARLAWLGALSSNPELRDRRPAVVDIGGRSTEIVTEKDGRLDALSRPPGARSLTEAFVESSLPWMLVHLQHLSIAEIFLLDGMRKVEEADTVVCIGGTAQAAVRLLGKQRITEDEIAGLADELGQMSQKELRERMFFDPERAEIIYGGLVILELFARSAPDREIIVSEGGVREGLLLDRTGTERLIWR